MDVSLMGKEELDSVFRSVLGPFLEPKGFVEITARKWVCDQFKPIRHLFVVQAMKGCAYVFIGGISLDYVPYMKGNTMAWHRTNRSSILDLRFDPVDHFSNYTDWYIDTLRGRENADRQAMVQLRKSWPIAAQFFHGAQKVDQLLDLFDAQMQTPTYRFGFANYVQQPLAYLLTLARSGQVERAMRLLEAYVDDYRVPEAVRAKLAEVVAAAK